MLEPSFKAKHIFEPAPQIEHTKHTVLIFKICKFGIDEVYY
jgi:hypothetical protein